MAGQGPWGWKSWPTCRKWKAVLVPIGGGGLISGVSTAIKEVNPSVGSSACRRRPAPPTAAAGRRASGSR